MPRLRNLVIAWIERNRLRRSLQPLMDASDRDLQDLGLQRQDLMALRAGYRIERPPVDARAVSCRSAAAPRSSAASRSIQ